MRLWSAVVQYDLQEGRFVRGCFLLAETLGDAREQTLTLARSWSDTFNHRIVSIDEVAREMRTRVNDELYRVTFLIEYMGEAVETPKSFT